MSSKKSSFTSCSNNHVKIHYSKSSEHGAGCPLCELKRQADWDKKESDEILANKQNEINSLISQISEKDKEIKRLVRGKLDGEI